MRSKVLLLALSLVLASPASGPAAPPPPISISPPGQVVIVSINARQHMLLGIKRFTMMFELSRALRRRPVAFDGGPERAVAPADVIVIQEIRASNLEIFERLLQQRYDFQYKVAGLSAADAVFIINTDTVGLVGEPEAWQDSCFDETNTADPKQIRTYQLARLVEKATGAPFNVAGVHFSRNYPESDCLIRNVQELKRRVVADVPPTYTAGDFNRRPVEGERECDPEELTAPLPWWALMTSSDGGPAFIDTVRQWHRDHGATLAGEWTHEQKEPGLTCDASSRIRRTRIDYLFATHTVTAEAHADHPGWAGSEPGMLHPTQPKYSDHRFLWGRYVVSGPPQPQPPSAIPAAEGVINLTWTPSEGATEMVVYRARGNQPYDELGRFPVTQTALVDASTAHGTTYRYAVAPIGTNLAQGLESAAARATADARGPRVVSTSPRLGATGVDPRTNIIVRFDDPIEPSSVNETTLMLFSARRRIPGEVLLEGRQRITLDPYVILRKGVNYHVVARSVSDSLGNRGRKYSWGFRTVEPPPPPPKRRKERGG